MSDVIYKPSRLSGNVSVPCSKSAAHRAVISAAMAKGVSRITNLSSSLDIEATARAVSAVGAAVEYDRARREMCVKGGRTLEKKVIDCGESGSTLRFMIPVAAALGLNTVFTGKGRLPERPVGIYTELLSDHGVRVKTEGGLPFEISGQLSGGAFSLPGNVSSQFITGLMLALPNLREDSRILLTTPLQSRGYVDLTQEILARFGIEIEKLPQGWSVRGNQTFSAAEYQVEGDWSQAAFFLCMAAFSEDGICVRGLRPDSSQGDMACVEIFRKLGVQIGFEGDTLKACNRNVHDEFSGLHAIQLDAAQIPDIIPPISICAALSRGRTVIYNAERLRLKESDRLEALEQAVNSVGGKAKAEGGTLTIDGVNEFSGGKACGRNDHRIVMSLAAAALKSKEPIAVTDAQSINKSYPEFFIDYRSIGGEAHVFELG